MASDAFNGTTATFATAAVGEGLRGVRYTESAATADVTGSADAEKTHEAGIPDKELTIDFVGTATQSVGDKGAIAITWDDATTVGSITNAVLTSINQGGTMDGEITGSATFKPSTAA